MFAFVFGCLLIVAGLIAPLLLSDVLKPVGRTLLAIILVMLGTVAVVFSTSLWVNTNSGGLITKKFGEGLKDGRIIAVSGQRGVQAEILSPGWSFGWAPWQYNLESVPNVEIKAGTVGVVTAMDGDPLPAGEIYAKAWASPTLMLDAKAFLTQGGQKGPQLTVLPPGQYRYNPKLFQITPAPCIDVPIGFAAGVRANAGLPFNGDGTNQTDVVNGVPLVPNGYKGLWCEPLLPGQYYMHPQAYQVILVRTTKRMYSYTGVAGSEANTASKKEPEGDNSIHVRSQDSFEFPVDVRVAVAISAKDIPYVVAKIADPDADSDKNGFDNIEERAILPSVRAILRNTAEGKKAMDYVNSRSQVEKEALARFTVDMAKDRLEVEGFYLADIGLSRTAAGKELLKTQTDKEIAMQQQDMYMKQVLAANERGKQVEAEEKANQQKGIQASQAGIKIAEQDAEAAKRRAEGDAAQALVYKAKIDALGGPEAFTKFEVTKMIVEKMADALSTWKPALPQTVVMGQGGGANGSVDGILAGILGQMNTAAMKPAVVAQPTGK
jgi:hypothetical protein